MEIDKVVEISAIILSLLYVWLAAQENKWCWLFGGLGSAIYVFINYQAALYYDAALQLYYVAVAIYALALWNNRSNSSLPTITKITHSRWASLMVIGMAATYVLGKFGKTYLAQTSSFIDAGVTIFSLIATWMTAKKMIENWWMWIAIDAVAAYMYFSKQLYATSGLYILFCLMACYGFWEWQKKISTGENRDLQRASS